jgi:hypothetical protein
MIAVLTRLANGRREQVEYNRLEISLDSDA